MANQFSELILCMIKCIILLVVRVYSIRAEKFFIRTVYSEAYSVGCFFIVCLLVLLYLFWAGHIMAEK